MIPDHDCVPGLNRPVTVSEYAKLEGLSEALVLRLIHEVKLRNAAYFRGQWFIEAPRNSEAPLAQLRGEQPPPRSEKVNTPRKGKPKPTRKGKASIPATPRNYKTGIPALEDKEFWGRIEREAASYDTPTDDEQNVVPKGTKHLDVPQPQSQSQPEPERLKDRTKIKTALWRAGCVAALFIGIGSCTGSHAISNDLVYSFRQCADGWPSQSIGIQGACSHHGGVVTREVDKRTGMQRYACYALNAAGIIGLITALFLWGSGGPSQTQYHAPRNIPATPPVDTPLCPRCSRHMIRRRARRGRHSGQFFWGCSNYPSCRGTRTL
jgi:hypothetical protein